MKGVERARDNQQINIDKGKHSKLGEKETWHTKETEQYIEANKEKVGNA